MFGFGYLDSGRAAIWALLGWCLGHLGRSWGGLGGILNALGAVLEASWALLGTLPGRSWRCLGSSCESCGALRRS